MKKMMKVFLFFFLFCSSNAFAGNMLNVVVETKAIYIDAGHIEIVGSANLPDGSIFYSSVWDSSADDANLVANIGQDRNELMFVKDGKFKIVRTPEKGRFFDRKHLVQLLLSPDSQPDTVKDIIGDKGQFLRGSCVKRIAMGVQNIAIDNIPLTSQGVKTADVAVDLNTDKFQDVIDLSRKRFLVTDYKLENDHIVVEVNPLFIFPSRLEIERFAQDLVRGMNHSFPGKRITIRIRKRLDGGMVKLYGEGYYDGCTSITAKSY